MSAANEMRRRVALVALAIGALLLLYGVFAKSGWGYFALFSGGALFAAGGIMFVSVSIINGVPWMIRLMSRFSDPVWDGEILHTDGDEYKIRYNFDGKGSPRFVANDVCSAVGLPPPPKDALYCAGIPLFREGKYAYFSEVEVQTYLASRAVGNRAANRLLVLIRSHVLRRIEKQREDQTRFGPGEG